MKKSLALIVVSSAMFALLVPLALRYRAAKRSAAEQRAAVDAQKKAQDEPDVISPDFLQAAWVVLLPVTRQKAGPTGAMEGVEQADTAMADLQRRAKTKADWLVWSQISDYSLAKLLQSNPNIKRSPLMMRNPDECVAAVMGAMRSRVLRAHLPVCDRLGLR